MRKQKTSIASGFALSALGSLLSVSGVFAANPYNINYTGGTALGTSNVKVDSSISKLVPLIKAGSGEGSGEVRISNSPKWETGYYKSPVNESCTRYNFIRIYANNLISSDDNVYYTLTNESYEAKMQINKVTLEDMEGLSEDGDAIAVGVHTIGSGYFAVGDRLYSDSQCQTEFDGIRQLSARDDGQVFVEANVKLSKKGESKPFVTDEMYYGLMDIDAAQSYKILNSTNLLSANNMFAVSETAFTYPGTDGSLKNMFVSNGNYIYSQYNKEDNEIFNTADVNNIYVKIDKATQQAGVNIVYGFASGAGSGIEYYTREYTVSYVSDENGEIDGIKEEGVFSGWNPAGSTSKPKDDFEFIYWVADKDVTLTDGTTIKAGEKITPEQVKTVVINENIKFTAVHESKVAVPDTGASTKEFNAAQVALPIVGILAGAMLIKLIPAISRKKVKFN